MMEAECHRVTGRQVDLSDDVSRSDSCMVEEELWGFPHL